MKRREFLQSTMLTLGALSVSKWSSAAPVFDPDWKIEMLTKDVGIFTEKGGTIAFHLSSDGITVIDAQFPDTAPHLIHELEKEKSRFRLLLNTHHHYDHTSGNISFKPVVDRVLAHENSLKNQRAVAEKQKPAQLQYFPTETFADGWSEKTGDETITLHYYGPAHTDGDAVIHLERNKIVHVGDLVFNRQYPYIDKAAGASISNWLNVLDRLQTAYSDDTTFVCGHAGEGFDVTGRKDMIRYFQGYLSASLSFVESEMRAGKTKEQIVAAKAIPGYADWKGAGIERTLTAAYQELTEK